MDDLTHSREPCSFNNLIRTLFLVALAIYPAQAADPDLTKVSRANRDLYSVSHSNGSRWFYFGLATIASCRSAAMIDESHGYEVYVAENKDMLENIKLWVAENFAKHLNDSPSKPIYFAEIPVKYLVLYSSPTVPASVLRVPGNLRPDDEKDSVDMQTLLVIPMIPLLFGNDSAKLTSTCTKLRSWLSPKNRAKPQPRPITAQSDKWSQTGKGSFPYTTCLLVSIRKITPHTEYMYHGDVGKVEVAVLVEDVLKAENIYNSPEVNTDFKKGLAITFVVDKPELLKTIPVGTRTVWGFDWWKVPNAKGFYHLNNLFEPFPNHKFSAQDIEQLKAKLLQGKR